MPSLNTVMAGLVPAIHVLHYLRMLGGYVYILASAPNGILYVGVTNDLVRRIYEHRNGLVAGFTKKYSVKRLVYFEHSGCDPARTQHEALVAQMESKIDPREQSGLGRSVRLDRLRNWLKCSQLDAALWEVRHARACPGHPRPVFT
jgi:predicted GIY-YIG superfamily endonuclease